jgi:hypothetical protein
MKNAWLILLLCEVLLVSWLFGLVFFLGFVGRIFRRAIMSTVAWSFHFFGASVNGDFSGLAPISFKMEILGPYRIVKLLCINPPPLYSTHIRHGNPSTKESQRKSPTSIYATPLTSTNDISTNPSPLRTINIVNPTLHRHRNRRRSLRHKTGNPRMGAARCKDHGRHPPSRHHRRRKLLQGWIRRQDG